MRRVFFVFLWLVVLPQMALAGVTGKISGVLVDKDTSEPLPAANVVVEGTHMGAMTDENGKFFILNVEPGKYAVRGEMMGYQTVRVSEVRVFSDRNTPLRLEMVPAVLEFEDTSMEVVASRALIERDVTGSMRTVGADQIQNMPINNVSELLATTAGVVSQGGELHFRGGRGNEAHYMVDGISVKDPIEGGSGLEISRAAIEEISVLQGGFDAEYGEAQSAIIKVVTKEGASEWSGSVRYKSDRLSPEEYSVDADFAEFSLSGPEPITNYLFSALGMELPGDDMTWFFTATGDLSNTHTPFNGRTRPDLDILGFTIPERLKNTLSFTSKWVWRVSNSDKLTFSVQNSWNNYDIYQHRFSYIPDHSYSQTQKFASLAYATWNHTISPKTFFELKLSRYQSRKIDDAGVLPDGFPLEPDLTDPGTVPWADGEFWDWIINYYEADRSDVCADGDILIDASEVWDDFGEDRIPNTFDKGEGDGIPNDGDGGSTPPRDGGLAGYADDGLDGIPNTNDYGEGTSTFQTYNSFPEFGFFVADFTDVNGNTRYDVSERDAGMGEWFYDRNGNGYYDAPNFICEDDEEFFDRDKNGIANSNDGFLDGERPAEEFTDLDGDGVYDGWEAFTDANSNGRFDSGEPYYDYGLDQIPNTNDAGEGNYSFDVHPYDPTIHEYYVDLNGNGNFDGGESFSDGESYAEDYYVDSNGDGRYNETGENWDDGNGNGRWDLGEMFQDAGNGIFDEGEPFSDAGIDGVPRTGDTGEANGRWDEGEDYYDSNGNGQYDAFAGVVFVDADMNGEWTWADLNGNGQFDRAPVDEYEIFYSDIFVDYGVDGVPATHDPGEANGRYDNGEPFFDVIGDGEWDRADTFVDRTGNAAYDGGEPFEDTGPDGSYAAYDPGQWNGVYDTGEPYTDLDGNGVYTHATAGNGRWDEGEPYQDANGDGEYDAPNGRWDRGEPYVDANYNGRWDDEYEGAFGRHSPYRLTEDIQYTLRASLESQVTDRHQVKVGAEFKQHFLEQQEIQYPMFRFITPTGESTERGRWPERGIFRNFWDAPPLEGAVWLQDQFEYEDLIVKTGIRYDFWVIRGLFGDGGSVPDTLRKTLDSKLSPRLGVSYPISDRDKMYFSYGHFSQRPNLENIYNSNEQGASALSLKGNYELESMKTVAYEFGIDHAFTDDVKVDAKAFFKDIRDLVQATRTVAEGTNQIEWVFQNSDYGNARGMELVLDKRYSNYTSGNISYTYQFAYGKNSSSWDGYGSSATTPREFPLDWDQRHSLSMNLDYRVFDDAPELFGQALPSDWGFNLLWQLGSGFPYTPTRGGKEVGARNSARLPWTSEVDVVLDKTLELGGLRYNVFTEISNLFDRENIRTVDSEYRTPYGDGRLISANPARILPGRHIEVGFEVGF